MNKLDRLLTMTDKEIQDWLRTINVKTDIHTLPIALLGANENIKECVFRNMSLNGKTSVTKSIQELSKKDISESEIQNNIDIIGNLL